MLYIAKLFLIFILFSFVGWCLEVLYGLFKSNKFVNRGFLIGPLCPIYGIGCLLIYFTLSQCKSDAVFLFLMSMILCSLLEYFVSFILEKIFKTRWWDYSDMRFNINGRICLEMLIPFGILCLILMYLVFPLIFNIANLLPSIIIYIMSIIFLIVFIIDVFLSVSIIINFKKNSFAVSKDSTEDIAAFVKNILLKNLKGMKS